MTFLIIFTGLVTNVPRQMSLYKFPGSILLSCLYVYIYIYIYMWPAISTYPIVLYGLHGIN